MSKPRGRDLGLPFTGQTGEHNAITDVPGVQVGYCTRIEGEAPLIQGKGPVRSGVTAILPLGRLSEPEPVWAGTYALNGNGEMTGTHWIEDGGYLVGPICLTNTHSVGMVHHAAVKWMINTYKNAWQSEHLWAMPVITETYDGVLNDINGQHITDADALRALDAATSGPLDEGNVGGGTGMICYEFKGGTGTASRSLNIDGSQFTMGTLVQANHGIRPWFTPLGRRVGEYMSEGRLFDAEQGSIVVVLATDLPLAPHQLRRIAKRAAIGIGRGGTPGGNNSGDIFLAFSTANRGPIPQLAGARRAFDTISDELFDPIYMAVTDVIEEAVINALLAAEDMTTLRPAGHVCRAIDAEQLMSFFND
ncbi:MAG: P1 family peptidase [Granulosicoccus sp.]|nr:P1 family peptidase [Granulosicoccus sp.]